MTRAPLPDEDWPVDPGRPWPLRLLALVGALSFLMLGLSSVVLPLLQRQPAGPTPSPIRRSNGSLSGESAVR